MIYRFLKIGRWEVDFFFAPDGYDMSELEDELNELDAPADIIDEIITIILSGYKNTGFTYTDSNTLRAVVAIGPSSSRSEFLNTCVHEIHHLAVAIADNLGIDLEGETPAYIAGDSAFELADLLCQLGCRRCNDE